MPQLCCGQVKVSNHFTSHFENIWRGNIMATPTVHNRGRGYSNSLTLCRDCTLSPQHSIHPSGTNPEFTILSMRIINPNLSITHPSISTSPVSLASQPWPTVILGTAQVDNLQGSLSLDLGREGTDTKVYKFPVKPYPNFRVLWLYGKIGMVSHPDNHQFYKGLRLMPQHFYHQNSQVFGNTCPKHFNRMIHHSKVFITIFLPSIPI